MKIKSVILSAFVAAAAIALSAKAESLILLHTNDTHSQIEPDANGQGGILQRKAIIDSIRAAEKNVMLIDAGDIVQGSLYFKFFGGEVEFPLANMAGYDIRILGNHEFDNGMERIAPLFKDAEADLLAANYVLSATPLAGMFKPYTIREFDGKKIGFIGINIDPESLIVAENYKGLKYKDAIATANEWAATLRNEYGCDIVVAVSHIGAIKENEKPTDYDLAAASSDIDIIIGGHSHTVISPDTKATDRADVAPGTGKFTPSIVANRDGHPVLVAQTGKYGRNLGYIAIDLDKLGKSTPQDFDYQLIPVTDRFPQEKLDQRMMDFISQYKAKVDSVNARVIAKSLYDLNSDARTGGYPNFTADFAQWYGNLKADSIAATGRPMRRPDFAVMNVGGIRKNMPQGDVTEGEMLVTFPFANHFVIMSLKGSDILKAMKMAAGKGGEGISSSLRVLTDGDGNMINVLLDGTPIDADKEYSVVTINYVAEGNDDFTSFRNGTILWEDNIDMSAPLLRYIYGLTEAGLPIAPDPTPRFLQHVDIR